MIPDLIEGITNVLKGEWDIPVYTDNPGNLELEKPNFSISVPYSEEKPLMGDRCVRQVMVDISYHPDATVNILEYYRIAERLFEITNLVQLPGGGKVIGQNKKFEFTEGVIIFHASFDFILTVLKERDEENLMGTVNNQTKLSVDIN